MADARKSILLRISPDLWAALNTMARDELRSVNAQIEYILRDAARRKGLMRHENAPPDNPDDSAAAAS